MNRQSQRSVRTRTPSVESLEGRNLLSVATVAGLSAPHKVHAAEVGSRHGGIQESAARKGAGQFTLSVEVVTGTTTVTPVGGTTVDYQFQGTGLSRVLGRTTYTYHNPASFFFPTSGPPQLAINGGTLTVKTASGSQLNFSPYGVGTLGSDGASFSGQIAGTLTSGTGKFARATAFTLGQLQGNIQTGTFTLTSEIFITGVRGRLK